MTCQPDYPFGCVETWGPPLTHVCNRDEGHNGRHKCKCGTTRVVSPGTVARARVLKPCGTVAAARRHQKAHEPFCGPCADAWREHQARMYRQRRA